MFDIPTVANSIGITTIDILNQVQNLKVWKIPCMISETVMSELIILLSSPFIPFSKVFLLHHQVR